MFIGPAVVLTNDYFPRAVNPDGTAKSGHDWEPVGVTMKEGCSLGARSVCVAPVTIALPTQPTRRAGTPATRAKSGTSL